MTASNYIDTIRFLPLNLANARIEDFCGISNFFKDSDSFCHSRHAERTEKAAIRNSPKLFLAPCFNLLDELCRIAAYDAHRRYIVRHHAVGTSCVTTLLAPTIEP